MRRNQNCLRDVFSQLGRLLKSCLVGGLLSCYQDITYKGVDIIFVYLI